MSVGPVLLALSLALDVFAAGLAYGLAALPRQRWFAVALIFSFFGVLMPLIGIVAGRWLSDTLGAAIAYLAGGFLIVIGLRALGEVFLPGADHAASSSFSLEPRAIILTGCVVALDNLAVGLALGVAPVRLGPILGYLAVQSFVAAALGLALGQRLGSRLGPGASALGGAVFVLYGGALVVQTAISVGAG
ncbi:MAG: manganese efflux pump [Chloroflexi bacterium]|nr:manganese efflux pump [Chloroflexota bacterium]